MNGDNPIARMNLEALRRKGREDLARLVEEGIRDDRVTVESSRSGVPTLLYDGTAVHSRYDPEREAKRLAERLLEGAGSATTEIVGLGMGYLVDELMALRPGTNWTVVEPSDAVFAAACQTRDLSGIIRSCELIVGSEEAARSAVHRGAMVNPGVRTYAHLDASGGRSRTTASSPEQVPFPAVASANTSSAGLRILVVGPLYGGSLPISGYVTSALRELGHRVEWLDHSPANGAREHFHQIVRDAKQNGLLLSQFTQLLAQGVYARAREMQAQLVLFMAQSPATPDLLNRLRSDGIPTAFWFVEDYQLLEYWRHIAPHVDVFFHIQKGAFDKVLEREGLTNGYYLPMAADPDVHRPLELSDEEKRRFGSDLSHVGAGYHNRRKFFPALLDYDFKLWGSDWEGAGELKSVLQDEGARVSTGDTVKVFNATRINLNLHSSTYTDGVNPGGDYLNPRTFELAACGAFQLVDERSLLPEAFEPGVELATFRDLESCRAAIEHYLAHPEEARRIAEAGRRRALREHTYRHRMEEAIRVIAGRVSFPSVRTSPNTVSALVSEAGEDRELADFFRRMGEPDEELTLDGVAEKIRREEGELGDVEALFLLMHEFDKWAREKGVA